MATAIPTKRRTFTDYLSGVSVPFYLIHIAAVAGVVWLGFSWSGVALALALYAVRMFFITAGFHRYFSHRAYKTSRWFQFLLAFGGTTSAQKGVLWWAAHHRTHHRLSDQEGDIHSAKLGGFFWSHVGWILVRDYDQTDWPRIRDFQKFPELRFLNRHFLLPPVMLAIALFLIGGWHALIWGFFVSTTLLWHGTFTINSLSHLFGRRRYATDDDSRNNWFLAIITLGEGWHNNHHHYQGAANQGFFWWEFDISYMILKALSWVGIVWDVRNPPRHILEGTTKAAVKTKAAAKAAQLGMIPATLVQHPPKQAA